MGGDALELKGQRAADVVQTDSFVVRDTEPIFTTIDGEVVMMSVRSQSYYGLGSVGSEVWNAIAMPCRVDEVCARLVTEFEVDPQTCQREVLDFLNDLVKRGLARVVAGDS